MRYLLLLILAGRMWGHDMWIETFPAGPVVGVKLRVGQDLLGDPIPRRAGLIREFVVVDGAGKQAVPGREGSDPAGFVRGGAAVIGYWSRPSVAELDGEKFNSYLREEGLDGVPRAARGAMVRDSFVRCAKTLIGGARDRVLGFPLELVAEQVVGEVLPVRLTYEGRAAAGVLVVAINKQRPEARVTARTDGEGRVRLRVAGPGMWLVKAVHMVPAGHDWASFWASLTFVAEGK